MPSGEIQTDAIVRDALALGKRVYVPYLEKSRELSSPNMPKSVMDMLEVLSLSDYDSLKRDSWGIPSIDPETVHERARILPGCSSLDLIMVPGVAFCIDPSSNLIRRLGHGKGFYDYFLHRYRERYRSREDDSLMGSETDVLLYGLALEEQFLPLSHNEPLVPTGEHDSLIHGLFVGNGKVIEGPFSKKQTGLDSCNA